MDAKHFRHMTKIGKSTLNLGAKSQKILVLKNLSVKTPPSKLTVFKVRVMPLKAIKPTLPRPSLLPQPMIKVLQSLKNQQNKNRWRTK